MKQFWEIKNKYPDKIILFRMGDFYETFEKDAILASKILGIALTKRANGAASSVPLAGFPYHSLDQYAHKLLKAGHCIAICEQLEDAKQSKGIVKRDVVEVLTPGTAINEKFLNEKENNYLLSVISINNLIAFSLLDHSTGELLCGETTVSMLNEMLFKYNVNEILMVEEQEKDIKHHFPNNVTITLVEDWNADFSSCYNYLIRHFNLKNLKGFGIESSKHMVVASSLSLKYVDNNSQGRINHINKIKIINEKGHVGLDDFTIKNLELFTSLQNQGIHGTLIGAIDKTKTSLGSRLLKNWIRMPITDVHNINSRLNRIQDLLEDFDSCRQAMIHLREIHDIERILARITSGKSNPKELLNLAISLRKIDEIEKIFNKEKKYIFKLIKSKNSLESLYKLIEKSIELDPPINIKKGNFIASGVSSELDDLRKISKSGNDWLVDYQIEQQKKYEIGSLKIGFNRVFGYYIEVTNTHKDKVPEEYIRKQTLTNAERYFTLELKEYEEKILSSETKMLEIEEKLFNDLNKKILNYIGKIQHNANIIAKFDIACSFAELSRNKNYCKPIISKKNIFKVKDSRHPVVEDLLPSTESFIGNDIELNSSSKQIAIITGPNMAGKSTFLRQIGLITILAHIGSYIPASYGEIGIVDKIFTRVGASDNLSGGESTFFVEMTEAANILNNATSKSLIILDEIGRGTSTFDGLSIAWSITEYIHEAKNLRAKTLFATHYHELVELAEKLKRAFNLSVAIKEHNEKIIYLKKIVSGGASKSYGIHVAKMAGLPKEIIYKANQKLKELTRPNKKNKTVKNMNQVDLFQEKRKIHIAELEEININNLTPIQALKILDGLIKKYRDELQK